MSEPSNTIPSSPYTVWVGDCVTTPITEPDGDPGAGSEAQCMTRGAMEQKKARRLSEADRKALWGLSRAECAFPGCQQRLVESLMDRTTGDEFTTIVGVEAHIRAFSEHGPRFDPDYPDDRLESYENRILLCPTHHTMVDAKGGSGFDVPSLLKMKREHEKGVRQDEELVAAIRAYVGGQMAADNHVQFRQARLDGPTVESMFVDVPFSCRDTLPAAEFLERLAEQHPGDLTPDDGFVATGAAQALLHPDWVENALIVGGPGQGKSTLLQYVCQFHRARYLGSEAYTGDVQGLRPVTSLARIPVKVELRRYAEWALEQLETKTNDGHSWPALEMYLIHHVAGGCGEHKFGPEHFTQLVARHPILLALDGLDEVADLKHRETAADQIVAMAARLAPNAQNLVILVTSRPGSLNSRLMSSAAFPRFNLHRLTAGLRLQYLDRWISVSDLTGAQGESLRRTYLGHEELPHIRDLASYPMQFAILLHLLRDRGLFPKQRTELYEEYLKAFLDREETEGKDPLVSSQRTVLLQLHAYLGWHMQTRAESAGDAGELPREELRRQLRSYFAGQPAGREFADQLFDSFQSRVLCLVEREDGFQFEVQSLREYFAALHIHENADPRGKRNSRVDCFEAMVCRPYWLNVCRFFVGMFTKIEIRGIFPTLRDLRAKASPALNAHLRVVAARLLDDRSYQGQSDQELRQIVGFILDGAGTQLAEDGFLDDSGSALVFAEDAGRRQAVDWLKLQLSTGLGDEERALVWASHLLRNSVPDDALRSWWWETYQPTRRWLRIASELGAFATLGDRESKLASSIAVRPGFGDAWATNLLVQGGYDSDADAVLKMVMEELNDGAWSTPAQMATPVGFLCMARMVAMGHPLPSGLLAPTGSRAQIVGTWQYVVAQSFRLGQLPPSTDTVSWRTRLRSIAQVWGSGWVLQQALSRTPMDVDFGYLTALMSSGNVPGRAEVELEAERRANRHNAAWWARNLPPDRLGRRCWASSLLSKAGSSVVEQLVSELDEVVAELAPKHYGALLRDVARVSATPLDLRDPLRLNRIIPSVRTLWLLRTLVTEGTRQQIDKRVRISPKELLDSGMDDAGELFRAVGSDRVTKVSLLDRTRSIVRPGSTDQLKLGRLSDGQAAAILARPEDWPSEVVALAMARMSSALGRQDSIASLAERHSWFTQDRD